MALCKVHDVNVVSNPGAVGGGIVGAENRQLLSSPDRDLVRFRRCYEGERTR